jgi:hypothetical protein
LFAGTQSIYLSAGSENSSSYSWTLDPAEAGNLAVSENGLECTVDWTGTFTGPAELKVKGINDCGESDFSEMLAVTVTNTFGIGENESGIGIAVYPNPNDGNFRVELSAKESTAAKLQLLTSTGEAAWGPVRVEINNELVYPVSLEMLPKGIYLLRVETTKGISSCKIIIKN